jgi:hypothetical protein
MLQVTLDFLLEPHLKSVKSSDTLSSIMKEVSDVICHCCYRV